MDEPTLIPSKPHGALLAACDVLRAQIEDEQDSTALVALCDALVRVVAQLGDMPGPDLIDADEQTKWVLAQHPMDVIDPPGEGS